MAGPLDVVSIALAVLMSVVALSVGLSADRSVVDLDQAVYQRTLEGMQDDQGYYDATRAALTEKEGAPPSQVRSVRPPTLFVVLRYLPEGSWHWLVGPLSLAVLLLAWRLARDASPLAGPVAVVLVGAYMRAAAPYLYLHAELWGLPLALGGLLAIRRHRWVLAAALLVGAVAVRELYLVYLLGAIAWVPRRRAFIAAAVVLAIAGAVHVVLASRILESDGREAPFANETGLRHVLAALGPDGGALGAVIGLSVAVIGLAVLAVMARRGVPSDARVALTGVVALGLAGATVGRTYWAFTFAPVAACYAAMAFGWLPARFVPATAPVGLAPPPGGSPPGCSPPG